jgi:hypothetical protein
MDSELFFGSGIGFLFRLYTTRLIFAHNCSNSGSCIGLFGAETVGRAVCWEVPSSLSSLLKNVSLWSNMISDGL